MKSLRPKVDRSALRVMTLFAATMALTVSLLPPTIFFYQGKQFLEGSVARSVKLKSIQISAMIGRNPELWTYESTRINDILLAGRERETYDVIALDGEHIASVGPDIQSAPEFAVEALLYDSGKKVAVLNPEPVCCRCFTKVWAWPY